MQLSNPVRGLGLRLSRPFYRLTSSSSVPYSSSSPNTTTANTIGDPGDDALAGDNSGAKGCTGGEEPLSTSSPYAPSRPKVFNSSVPGGVEPTRNFSPEQRREIEEHNKEFEQKHDRGHAAHSDKVDEEFWSKNSRGKKQE